RAGGDRPLSLHQRAQPLARRRRTPAYGRDDVAGGLCRQSGDRVRGQPALARGRPARCLRARAHRVAPAGGRESGRGDLMRPVTLITGASAGIGTALAHVFAKRGHELVLVARREQRLAELASAIMAQGHKRPLVLPIDLALPDAVEQIGDLLTMYDVEPDIVVNNAGFGLIGPAADLDLAEQLAMVDVNVRALTDLSLAFVPSLERHKGGILNVASVAGFLPGPGMAVYYASKAYVVSFSEALHRELAPRGVRVT